MDLEYLRLSGGRRALYRIKQGFGEFPRRISSLVTGLPVRVRQALLRAARVIKEPIEIFLAGDRNTRISFLLMGFAQIAHGQIARGILYLLFQIVYFAYMLFFGFGYLRDLLTLGEVAVEQYVDPETGLVFNRYVDNSMLILLYGLLSCFFTLAFLYLWHHSCRAAGDAQRASELRIRLPRLSDDLRALTDRGLRVPQDISVTGFDGTEMTRFYIPSIATVRQPTDRIAKESVALLHSMLEGEQAQYLNVGYEVIMGESLAPLRY